MTITPNDLQAIVDRRSLFAFLRDKLRWPLDAEDPYAYDEPDAVGRAAAHATLSRLLPFTAGDPFVIFLLEFQTDFRRADLREILRGIKARIRTEGAYDEPALENLFFVCATRADEPTEYGGLRFAHFEERMGQSPRLRVFGYDRESLAETRTLREVNLSALGLAVTADDLPDWTACQRDWLSAWDVEKVTKDFFNEYKRVFGLVEGKVTGVVGDKRLWTQRLFNRLLFVQFLSKKDWMEFDGRRDYLFALRDAARASGENFFADRLYWLFFYGLGTIADSLETHTMEALVERRGHVPFLNGGLFEMVDADDERYAVTVPNEAFDFILDELFARFNFTITESTPDDQEVAVDPEMLGKVFEELITGRHDVGAYYTPRSVVQFMCRETLKGFLAATGVGQDRLARLVDDRDDTAVTVQEAKRLLAHLASLRAVDPACGSGAYLLGLMSEIFTLTRLLDTRADAAKSRDDYDRKLLK